MIFETKHVRPDRMLEVKAITESFYKMNCDHFEPEFKCLSSVPSVGKIHIGIDTYARGNSNGSYPGKLWAHVAAAWVTDDFVSFAKTSEVCPVLLHTYETMSGSSPFPTVKEIAASNAGEGLNLFIAFWHWRREPLNDEVFNAVEEGLRRRLLKELRGWNIQQCLMETFSRYIPWSEAFGLVSVGSMQMFQNRRIQLMGRHRIDLTSADRPKAIWDLISEKPKARLGLTEQEKRIVLLLMRGSTRKVVGGAVFPRRTKERAQHKVGLVVDQIRTKLAIAIGSAVQEPRWEEDRILQFFRDNMQELRPTERRRGKKL